MKQILSYFITIIICIISLSGCFNFSGNDDNKDGYKVIYNGNGNTGGKVPVDDNIYKKGDVVSVMTNNGGLEKTDYSFTFWNTVPDGSGKDYEATGSATFTMGNVDVNLYAKWTADETNLPEPGKIKISFAYSRSTIDLYSAFITGTASSDNGIDEINFDTGSGWQTAEGKENWKFSIPRTPGWNIGSFHSVSVRAKDTAGSISDSVSLEVRVGVNKDFNGDGYSDVIAGAYNAGCSVGVTGRAYIFFGGPEMDDTADVILDGFNGYDYFGYSVASAGDVNNDNYADAVVGAYLAKAGTERRGQAYVYFGGTGMDAEPDFTMSGIADGDSFGYSVASAGDVNGDGITDVIVGAPQTDNGQAFIFFGGITINETPDKIINGINFHDQLGWSVASAGDVNGDGIADIIAGAPQVGSPIENGQALIFLGESEMSTEADLVINGKADRRFGYSVASAGDMNNDGYADVIIGEPYEGPSGGTPGKAYIYYGSGEAGNWENSIITGISNDNLGASAASAGDVNGDGFDDAIIGAYEAGGNGKGQAYIIFGGIEKDAAVDMIFTGENNNDHLGLSVACAGDVNGDGYADIIIGTPCADKGWNRGKAYIYFGGPGMDSIADITLTGEYSQDFFGISVD